MSSSTTSHLTVSSTIDAQDNKESSSSNLCSAPCDDPSNLSHLSSSSPTRRTISKYFYYVNPETSRKPDETTTTTATTITAASSPSSSTPANSSHSNLRRKISGISLQAPWSKRTRPSSEEKLSTKVHHMSRDRLLPLERLLSRSTNPSMDGDDEQNSPITDQTFRVNEKLLRQTKENGHLHNSSQLKTR